MADNKVIAALYIRVSTREQAEEGYSLEAQERVLREYCRARKYDIYKVYRDEGISAKDIRHRPGLLSLLSDAQGGKISVILVWRLTRFSRNLADLVSTCEALDKLGVTLVSCSEAFDSRTPAGRMVRSMLGTVAQYEREVVGEAVALAALERAKQGKRTCSNVLGYDRNGKDSFCINDTEAEYVRFCYDYYLIYKNFSEVAALAKKSEYKGKRGKQPTAWSVEKILTHPIYAGYNLFRGQLYKGIHPPIIPVAQYNRVQRLIMRQGKTTGRKRRIKLYIVPEQ